MKEVIAEQPDKYEIATEVLCSAIRVLQAAGFSDSDILRLFDQIAKNQHLGKLNLAKWRERK
jgi:hypothetical protein